ncbi:MAG TPA: hypothetical protein ENG44_03245 [Desulfurococcaceae archaeon]|nr:hypothetical protein [Desulfurococcaceae archaeon]
MSTRPLIIGEVQIKKPRKNYDFTLTASAYNFSWWFNGKRLILPMEDDVVVTVIEDREELIAKIYSFKRKEVNIVYIEDKIRYIIGVDEDLKEFYNIMSRDPILGPSASVLHGLHVRATTPWLATVIGVCQQNASFKQGWRMLYNMLSLLGKRVRIENTKTIIPPKPSDINEDKLNILKEAKLGYRARTVIELAKLFSKEECLNDWSIKPSVLEEKLLNVKGIGNYTTRLALVLSLRYYEKPPIDRWLKRLIIEAYNVDESNVEEEYIKRWSKWSGLAALFTTIALDAEPLTKALERLKKGLLKPSLDKLSPLTLWRHF